MAEFSYDLDGDGVATITWDVPGKSMNVMSLEGLELFEALIDRALGDGAVKGVVFTSGKDSFAGGMDLNIIARMKAEAGDNPAKGLFDGLTRIHAMMRKVELAGRDPKTRKGGKPIAAALPGTALGLGLELPLACHRIFAADNPRAKIGLPEIMVGIFPGAGGTTRLSRKLGAMAASPILLEGRLFAPDKAKGAGIVDEVVPAGELLARAKAWVLEAKEADLVKPWDAKGEKIPGGTPYHPAGFMTYVGASAMVNGKTKGVYPAAKALLSAVYEGAQVDIDTALRIEARWFTSILMNPSSEAMIRSLFINKEALEKGARRPDVPDESVRTLGVLGAGMMGAGIAHAAAMAGIRVVLIDQSREAAEKGKSHAEALLQKAVSRRKATPQKMAEVLGRIAPTDDFADLAECDLVVEAVFEDPQVKAEATAKAEAHLPATAIFATNTSTLPITGLAKASRDPAQFIGIHFFSPVDKMMLVEIIKGKQTGDRAVAKALDFVRQIRKTPIVVNDARYFYANRCILPYVDEGVRMVREGVLPALVENAAKLVGMPVGPLQLIDEVSIDLGAKIARATKAAMGDAYPADNTDDVIFWMEEQGRLGRKSSAGFYAYDEKGKRTGLWKGLADRFDATGEQPELTEIQQRLLMAQCLEAVRALEEGVLMDVREGDVASILGWGFAPWSGGVLSWLDMIGAAKAVEICDRLEAAFGARFAAPALLRDLAEKGEGFYARYLPAQAA
ncbi:3-hydroxyacyl-CoA dehydrogenase NAD-binding domain-containing protein [Poseidonocella sp. HB161398]|uniref:3-hydroxyacyl-CoA dehydrogenase NAD-binding domain-containing protein n=1 Tax=Poseidonocella sp. HB161398 TaxID=2320855 RepID=UPI00110862A0|nr:3-hydroxyacyl-CoA dehydrogenase NAD-binding domain-containing protein [Poseidonocella sp. HB161398]